MPSPDGGHFEQDTAQPEASSRLPACFSVCNCRRFDGLVRAPAPRKRHARLTQVTASFLLLSVRLSVAFRFVNAKFLARAFNAMLIKDELR